ncbi:hypothetical protein CPB84DRAFT_1932422 [Gymnopilus junonius]|uniref:Uncharacterized protein n=1 Tax=Gymnopilus junonius TaxID=109634 RepID=A0A9P5NID5_GYMJU|nr:hypothetical protein CPB84DRAFT_1932422 [Gymnopilus junonius]
MLALTWLMPAGIPMQEMTGIGPEMFTFISSDGNFTGSSISAEQLAFYSKHGYCITGSDCMTAPRSLNPTSMLTVRLVTRNTLITLPVLLTVSISS